MFVVLPSCLKPRAIPAGTPSQEPVAKGSRAEPLPELVPEPPLEPLIDEQRETRGCIEFARCPTRAQWYAGPLYAGRNDTERIGEVDRWFPGMKPVVVAAIPDDETARIEVACMTREYWISLFVEPGALAQVVREAVQAVPRVTWVGKSRREGLYLAAGTRVEVVDRKGDFVEVILLVDDQLGGTGWVPSKAVGRTYTQREGATWSYPADNRHTFNWNFVTLADRPGGNPFAKLSRHVELLALGKRRQGQVLVAAGNSLDEGSHAVGWIDEDAFTVDVASPETIPEGVPGGIDAKKVQLSPGTIFSLNNRSVGEVILSATLTCKSDCNSSRPKVEVWCGSTLTFETRPPHE